jgi:putative peptide zinc metalloprotease protein
MYRLGRWARLRTDLGGIYFDMVNTVVLMGLYTLTHQPLLLAAVLLLDLEMVDQFDPVMRFDGYWALADLLGVPDFYVFMGPVLRGMIPKRWRPKGQEAPPLKGWVKIAFLAYTVIAVPVVFVTFASLLLLAPLFLVTYWNSLVLQWIDFATAWAHHDTANSIVGGVQVVILVLSAYFLGYAVYGLLRTIVRMLWKLGHADTRRQRAAAWLLTVVVALFFWEFWVPQVMAIGGAVTRMTVLSQSAWGATGGDLAPPEQLPTPGQNGFITRTAPSQSTATGSSPNSGSTSQTSTSGVTTTKPASDPSASKSGSTGKGNTGNTHKGGSGNPNPQPTPTPKPKRTPPPGFPTPPPPPTFPTLP